MKVNFKGKVREMMLLLLFSPLQSVGYVVRELLRAYIRARIPRVFHFLLSQVSQRGLQNSFFCNISFMRQLLSSNEKIA